LASRHGEIETNDRRLTPPERTPRQTVDSDLTARDV
jgi:hypothetical protein